jgi:probable H4MPT-linked C1 transfer pathway protein
MAHLDGSAKVVRVAQYPCALWQGLTRLDEAMGEALATLGASQLLHAITMTGELVDLFPSREEGVAQLVAAASAKLKPSRVRIYAGCAGFVAPDDSRRHSHEIASANWLASATLISKKLEQALFVDIGSTTTDIAPIAHGVQTQGYSDYERLCCEELVYTGVVRTPLMALAQRAPFGGVWVPLIPEYFATMADVYRITGQLPDRIDQSCPADGAGKTQLDSIRRLSRMLGRDAQPDETLAWRQVAAYLAGVQFEHLRRACDRALSRGIIDNNAPLVGAGVGRFLVRKLAQHYTRSYLDFSDLLESSQANEEWISSCAPAVAVAYLAQLAA